MIEPDMSYWNTNQVKDVLKRWCELENLIYKCCLTHRINENEFKQYQIAKALFYRLTYLSDENKNVVGYIYCHEDVSDIPTDDEIMDHFGFSKAQLERTLNIIYYDVSQPRKERHAKKDNGKEARICQNKAKKNKNKRENNTSKEKNTKKYLETLMYQ